MTQTGNMTSAPFKASPRKVKTNEDLPCTRPAFLAPTLPLPSTLISFLPRIRTTIKPAIKLPSRYAKMKYSIIIIDEHNLS